MNDASRPAGIGHNTGFPDWHAILDILKDATRSIRKEIDDILVTKKIAGNTLSVREFYEQNRKTLTDDDQLRKATQLAKDLRDLRKKLVDIIKYERKPLDEAIEVVKTQTQTWVQDIDDFGTFVRDAIDAYTEEKLKQQEALAKQDREKAEELRNAGTPEAAAQAQALEDRASGDGRTRVRSDHGAMVSAKLVWKVIRITDGQNVDRKYCEPSLRLLQTAINQASEIGPKTLEETIKALSKCCEIRQEVDSRVR